METIQQLITPYTTAWFQTDSQELVTFGIFFVGMWLNAMVLEGAGKIVTKEG